VYYCLKEDSLKKIKQQMEKATRAGRQENSQGIKIIFNFFKTGVCHVDSL